MSTGNVLGVVPKLLPVTATFAAPLALINFALASNCIVARVKTSTTLGRASAPDLIKEPTGSDPLLVATSMHTNFIENAPLALIFAALVELNGGNRKVLAYTLGIFSVARVSHAIGLMMQKTNKFRQLGFVASALPLLGLAGWSSYLASSYWGL